MIVFEEPSAITAWVLDARREREAVGLVPTMGALHAGHLSLVQKAKHECDVVVTTIFVNPTQFGPQEDFSRYPRPLHNDLALLESAGVDAVFIPDRDAMYPRGFQTSVHASEVSKEWEGAVRPTHFQGVMTVVLKLFNLIPATQAYFGQKDLQQFAVIERMTLDLNVPVRPIRCPIVREPDGLAMSSRNVYLSPQEREQAACLYRAIQRSENAVRAGETDADKLTALAKDVIVQAQPSAIDYVAVVDAHSMQSVTTVGDGSALILAARFGNTRLLDNTVFHL